MWNASHYVAQLPIKSWSRLRANRIAEEEIRGRLKPLSVGRESSLNELNLQKRVSRGTGDEIKDSTPLGTIELTLKVQGDRLVARTKKWLPVSRIE